MPKAPTREDEVLWRMLKTPPKPFTPMIPKTSLRPPATKAETAALKRADKMIVKRMRKR